MSDYNKEKKVRDRTKDETGKYNDPELEAEEEQDRREGRSKRGKESKNKDTRVKVFVDGYHVGYEGGRKSRRKTKRHRRKTKRRRRKTTHRRKHRVKRRRKTTRKKRGRGISPSRMAKGTVAALAASEMMKQGSAVVSPQGRAVQQRLRSVNCDTIAEQGRQLIKPLHPDHGGTDEDFIAGMNTLTHRRGQWKLNRKRGDTGRNKPKPKPGESAKKARQRANRARRAKAEAARKAKQQEEQTKAKARAKAKAKARAQEEADARAGRQESQRGSTKPTVVGELAKAGAMGAAAAVGLGAAHQLLGKKESDKPGIHRMDFGDGVIRRFQGPYDTQSRGRKRYKDTQHTQKYFRELTPERENKPERGPVYSNFLGNVAYHT